ncbi:MAG TPA: FAD-dependent oxidoreductase [Acidimicrobiales bacterium]|nr:FAD-dependent oxidoreductase [Acidimicrobiales bacterium]
MRPAIVVIASDDVRRTALVDALERRFGADYDVAGTAWSGAGEGALAGWPSIAVAFAPIGAPDFAALRSVGAAHPRARRVAVVDVGDTSVAEDLGRALTLSHVDYYVGFPWASPEEELYPVVSEALRVWAHDQQLRLAKATLVFEPGDERGEAVATAMERNGIPIRVHAPTSAEGQELLAGPLAGRRLPVLQLWDGRVLEAPDVPAMVEAMGAHTRPALPEYDVAIVGTGPAGLAAATYAASEGLRAVAVEAAAIGGQASTSAKISNYLGFPWGIRGADLAAQAGQQAEQLGAEFVFSHPAVALGVDGDELRLELASGDRIRARTVILAGGVTYRRCGVPSVDALIGHGVFYGASAGEAAAMAGLRVAVLGGGNSAGQAAAHLAAAGASVTVLLRGGSLAKSMSDYLVQQLAGTANVAVRTNVQVTDALGDRQLTGLVLADTASGTTSVLESEALFVFIGARPHTEWLNGAVDLDDHGFVLTGRGGAGWLETSMPCVFAAGDIRAGSVKRVAAAVGEGSTAAMLAREALERPLR